MAWLVPFARLTPEQQRAVEQPMDGSRAITGPPGSGKSMVLVHRADYLRTKYGLPPDSFKLFVYTNALKEYIQADSTLIDLPEDSVCTWDSWCCDYYRDHIGRQLPWNRNDRCPAFTEMRAAVRSHLLARRLPRPLYEFVLVDEAQDIDAESLSTLTLISRHLMVAMDQKQRLYEEGTDERQVLEALGLKQENIALINAFRCCPHVHNAAACFLLDEAERGKFLAQKYTPTKQSETVVLYKAADYHDESENLIRLVRERVNMGERVAILVPTNRLAIGNTKGLQEAGIPAEFNKEADHTSDAPKVMTYYSAKGLTFNSVFMPYLSWHRFENVPTPPEDLLFVGTTRAQDWVYMSTSGTPLPQLEWLEPEIGRSVSVRQKGEEVKPTGQSLTTDDIDIL
ncbi:MAG: AAA family ATPase [Armatimonadetes bacterium]|nr:AAA family ATPase [Armatimonadota bacterium]